jgi:hypothetical protein
MALDEAVWTASNNRMEWNKTVALKRRTVPMEVENLMNDVLLRQQAADEELKGDILYTQIHLLPPSGERFPDNTPIVSLILTCSSCKPERRARYKGYVQSSSRD